MHGSTGDNVRWFNAENEEFSTSAWFGRSRKPTGIVPIESGWIVMGYRQILEFDHDFNLVKTLLPSAPLGNHLEVGILDQVITAQGEVLDNPARKNLRAVQLKGNRIETMTLDEFDNASSRN